MTTVRPGRCEWLAFRSTAQTWLWRAITASSMACTRAHDGRAGSPIQAQVYCWDLTCVRAWGHTDQWSRRMGGKTLHWPRQFLENLKTAPLNQPTETEMPLKGYGFCLGQCGRVWRIKIVAAQHWEATKATELCIEGWLKWLSFTYILPLLFFLNKRNITHVTLWVSESF